MAIRATNLLILAGLLAYTLVGFCDPGDVIATAATPNEEAPVADSAFHPRTGTFFYTVDWGGAPAGDVKMTVSKQGDY